MDLLTGHILEHAEHSDKFRKLHNFTVIQHLKPGTLEPYQYNNIQKLRH